MALVKSCWWWVVLSAACSVQSVSCDKPQQRTCMHLVHVQQVRDRKTSISGFDGVRGIVWVRRQ